MLLAPVLLALLLPLSLLAPSSAQAVAPSFSTQDQVKKAMLTLPQAARAASSKPLASDGLTCHHAPYLTGSVNYCYYQYLHSPAASAAKTPWPNHVDIISLYSVKAASTYMGELATQHAKSQSFKAPVGWKVFYDTSWPAMVPGMGPGAAPVTVNVPTVSVFVQTRDRVVYVACTDPAAKSAAGLIACAMPLAKAQVLKANQNLR